MRVEMDARFHREYQRGVTLPGECHGPLEITRGLDRVMRACRDAQPAVDTAFVDDRNGRSVHRHSFGGTDSGACKTANALLWNDSEEHVVRRLPGREERGTLFEDGPKLGTAYPGVKRNKGLSRRCLTRPNG